MWIVSHMKDLPALGLPEASSWRYLLMTGILPAIPIALLLPFVPESKVWKDKKAAGLLKRASFGALFSPELRRVTIVTAILSACAYGIAFGALQLTPLRIAPGDDRWVIASQDSLWLSNDGRLWTRTFKP